MSGWPTPDRLAEVENEIRRGFQAGDGHRAVNTAIVWALQPAAAYRRRFSPEDAALADADLAAAIFALAARWHLHQAERLAGCPKRPLPSHVLAAFDAALAAAAKAAERTAP